MIYAIKKRESFQQAVRGLLVLSSGLVSSWNLFVTSFPFCLCLTLHAKELESSGARKHIRRRGKKERALENENNNTRNLCVCGCVRVCAPQLFLKEFHDTDDAVDLIFLRRWSTLWSPYQTPVLR